MNADALRNALDRSPLFQSLGLRVRALAADGVCLGIDAECPTHAGAFGMPDRPGINGAVLCAALEAAIGLCGQACLGDAPAAVIELSVKLQRPVRTAPCRIAARPTRSGRGLAFVCAVLSDARDRPCATASGIVVATRTASARDRPLD
ncbi:PaaI family thioesterase [Xanthomonas campestris pv. phormiicola]|nr:PaaI family thioesterase [Xanthomonas campestris pv. phormiicola]UYC17068.1 PaaI family thioesterase [Xanthomonas campestris pv. phormiicola]